MQIPQALPQLLPLALREQNQLLIYKAKQWEENLLSRFPLYGRTQHQGKKENGLDFNFDLPLTSYDILIKFYEF